MGVLYDYFAAPSDEAAAATIDLPGGPGGAAPEIPGLADAMRSGDRDAMTRLLRPSVRLSEHGLHVLSVKGIEPTVQIDTLESLLTGESHAAIVARKRDRLVALRDGGERLVLRLSPELHASLSAATPERLADVAQPWSRTAEFWGQGDPAALAGFLTGLAALARAAEDRGDRLYCWTCV